jgi:RNA polymerase sigma-70 factor (ECF subfamily)
MKTPASLLERLRQPADPAAWERFVALYAPLIYSWGRRAGLQDADAADLVQDVLVTLVRALPSFTYDQHKSFRRWLRTVTLNKWRDRCKLRAARPLPGDAGLEEAASPEDPDAFWEAEYRRHLVGRALEVMRAEFQPATWKACWELVVAGRPAAEVASELGMTPGASSSACAASWAGCSIEGRMEAAGGARGNRAP